MEQRGLKATREGFGKALYELGLQDERVVALCADLTESLKMDKFRDHFPQRFFECGVAEANMISVAAGLATAGFIPFVGTFANFGTGRVYDQIRQSVAYSEKNVKICCSHSGLSLGEDGATHQILEDIALMRVLPNMCVVVPADAHQTYQATKAIYAIEGPAYLRFSRPKTPVFLPENDPTFQIGKVQVLKEGQDVSLFACGLLVWHALQAAYAMEKQNISVEVINVHTIKPIDIEGILTSVMKTGVAVVAEEHQKYGGLGGAIAEVLVQHYPVPMLQVAVNDTFGESGTPEALFEKYGLNTQAIQKQLLNALHLK